LPVCVKEEVTIFGYLPDKGLSSLVGTGSKRQVAGLEVETVEDGQEKSVINADSCLLLLMLTHVSCYKCWLMSPVINADSCLVINDDSCLVVNAGSSPVNADSSPVINADSCLLSLMLTHVSSVPEGGPPDGSEGGADCRPVQRCGPVLCAPACLIGCWRPCRDVWYQVLLTPALLDRFPFSGSLSPEPLPSDTRRQVLLLSIYCKRADGTIENTINVRMTSWEG